MSTPSLTVVQTSGFAFNLPPYLSLLFAACCCCDFVRSVGVHLTVLPCCPRRRPSSIALLPLLSHPLGPLDQTNGSRSTVRSFCPLDFLTTRVFTNASHFDSRPGLLYIASLDRRIYCYCRHVRLLRAKPSRCGHRCMARAWPPAFVGTACPSLEIRLVDTTTRRPGPII
jgi:hypothetical protein